MAKKHVALSLFWRTFFLLAILLAGGVFAWTQTFRAMEFEPRAVQAAQQIAALVNLSRAALRSTDGINPVWNSRGPNITGQQALVWGLLYVSGEFDAQGTPLYFGSVVTKAGMVNSLSGTPDLFWDTDLKDNWPPPGWELPRVIITKWETDL